MSDTLTVMITTRLGDGEPVSSERQYPLPSEEDVIAALRRLERIDPMDYGRLLCASRDLRRLMDIPEYVVTESTWTAPGGSFVVINPGPGPLDVTTPAGSGTAGVVTVAPGNMMLWLRSDLGGSP